MHVSFKKCRKEKIITELYLIMKLILDISIVI